MATDVPITVLSIRKSQANNNQKSELIDSLESEKKKIQSQIDHKQAEQKVLDQELSILQSNQSLRGENEKISAQEIKQAMEYFREKLTEIETSRISINNTLQEAQEKLREVNRQINELQQKQRKQSGQIIAEIESPRSQSVNFSLSYFIQNAGWYPSYDIRVDDIDRPLKMTYKANIYQSTGINWDNIQLTVSSAQPLSSTNIPAVQPVYLRFQQPEAQRRLEEQESRMKSQRLNDVVVSGQAQEMAGAPAVTVRQSQTSFSFSIENPYSVSGDGESKTVNMQEHSMPADYRYFAIPKAQTTAYLTALITDWEDLNLLDGEANLYFEQTFVGQSQVRAGAVGDTLQFSLGKDEGIAIERNRLKEFTEKNFFGNKVRETRAWELVIKNSKTKDIDITLVDQVPVSTNEDIKVDLQEQDGATYNKSTGKLSWNLPVKAGENQKRTFRYQIEYPSGKQIEQQ